MKFFVKIIFVLLCATGELSYSESHEVMHSAELAPTNSKLTPLALETAAPLALDTTAPLAQVPTERLMKEARAASPSKAFKLLNSGWSRSFQKLGAQLKKKKSYLGLHATEHGMRMDLRTPEDFRVSFVNQALGADEVDIGHVWISWRCQTKTGIKEGAAGQVGNFDDQFLELVKTGWGLASFKSHFKDGFLETPELIERTEIPDSGLFHSMYVEVDDSVCGDALKFINDYLNHPREPHHHYGLEGNPFLFQGGGCGSFGVAVAEVSKMFGQEFQITKNFWRTLIANPDLFGFGLSHPKDVEPFQLKNSGSKVVPAMKVLSQNWNGSNSEMDPQLTIMDPEMLLLSFKTIYRSRQIELEKSGGARLRKIFSDTKEGSLFPYRKVVTEGDRVLDENFDLHAEQSVSATLKWLEFSKLKSRILWIRQSPAVVFEK